MKKVIINAAIDGTSALMSAIAFAGTVYFFVS